MKKEEFIEQHIKICTAKRKECAEGNHRGNGKYRESHRASKRKCAKSLWYWLNKNNLTLDPAHRQKERAKTN